MNVSDFDFELPEERIALRPAKPRDSAKMLVVHADGALEHAQVKDLPRFLSAGDAVVHNNTRVFHARLRGRRSRGASHPKIEIMLHMRVGPNAFRAFARPARKLEEGDSIDLGASLKAVVQSKGTGGEIVLVFSVSGVELDVALAAEGEIPLPPYIVSKRAPDSDDEDDYQTIFAQVSGSVAAPTAGLHFTPALVARLTEKRISQEAVTLHVGAGTFLPVSASDTADHHMHAEWASLDAATAQRLNQTKQSGSRVVCVGTTTLRTLESACTRGLLHSFQGETEIFITPGFKFQVADAVLTNFHLPRSTLFMLVCAFSGLERMRTAYAKAVQLGYRFYSYGDACLLMRPATGPKALARE